MSEHQSRVQATWFGGVPRVMFVHAHPDDETISSGGTLAALSEAGLEPLLVTLTRGEQGEVTPGPFAALQGTEDLAPHRQNELATALAMLGVERHVFLGVPPARAEGLPPTIYEDSGMVWGADGRATAAPDSSADALTRVPVAEALNDLIAAAATAGAGAIVSYDDDGGYGHPDHVFAHRLARAVAHGLEIPFWVIVTGADGEDPDSLDQARDDSAIERHDVSPWFDRKVAALRAHGTQLSVDGEEIVHVGGQRQPIDRFEVFRRMPQL
ncbi:PIG-L family deacetylase [Leucobacter insecticola]|uniref:PIG-L family deacetylase n=1 Tax=Leucobacter insecticola TaxID=2714934 RepID=UPI001FCA6605|nr:PIG-L family deacetylase [Leucobacter insecticola]